MKCIINGKIVLENQILQNKVLVFNNKIADIANEVPNECEIIDAKGKFVTPGLIDIHIHGNMGKDTMDGSEESLTTIAKSIARYGVTSFLPTTMTMDEELINNALKSIKDCMNNKIKGSQILGAHLEGPFINNDYRGAQNSQFIVAPSYDLIKQYEGVIKIITYAPETDKEFQFTREICRS
jgi:N-acetylglucosamine-6-phosphate deacetylase